MQVVISYDKSILVETDSKAKALERNSSKNR